MGKAVKNFRTIALSQMFDRVLNTPLNLIQNFTQPYRLDRNKKTGFK